MWIKGQESNHNFQRPKAKERRPNLEKGTRKRKKEKITRASLDQVATSSHLVTTQQSNFRGFFIYQNPSNEYIRLLRQKQWEAYLQATQTAAPPANLIILVSRVLFSGSI
jgi:hypothetical protein